MTAKSRTYPDKASQLYVYHSNHDFSLFSSDPNIDIDYYFGSGRAALRQNQLDKELCNAIQSQYLCHLGCEPNHDCFLKDCWCVDLGPNTLKRDRGTNFPHFDLHIEARAELAELFLGKLVQHNSRIRCRLMTKIILKLL